MPGMQRAGVATVSSPALSKRWRDLIRLITVVMVSTILLTEAGLKPGAVSIVVFVEVIVVGSLRREER
jgi:hypothetical protein